MLKIAVVRVFLIISIFALTQTGCFAPSKTRPPQKRYKLEHDAPPHPRDPIRDLSKIQDAEPKLEPKSKIGNPKTYKVFNKSYQVLPSSKGYKVKGIASWYGKKFHGYKTSSGEVYDMYAMSAAHKTLPLPTYAKITNIDNGKSVVVKINDRGPFHGDRLIDLSYAAACKLGILEKGTANVEILALDLSPKPKKKLQTIASTKKINKTKINQKIKPKTKTARK